MRVTAGADAADDDAGQRPTDYQPVDQPLARPPMESTLFARSDASALADLQLHWASAYEIGLDGDIWSATFRGTADELRARSSAELRVLIRSDYSYRQQEGPTRHGLMPVEPDERAENQSAMRSDPPRDDGITRGERMSL